MQLTKPSLYRVQQRPLRELTVFPNGLIHSRPKKLEQHVFRASMGMFEQQDISIHATHLENDVVQIFHDFVLETFGILPVDLSTCCMILTTQFEKKHKIYK